MPKEKPADPMYRVLRGFRSGDVVFVENEKSVPREARVRLDEWLDAHAKGLRVVILNPGQRVVAREDAPAEEVDGDAYRELARSVRDFLAYIQDSGQPQSIDNSRTELALILAMRDALDGVPK
jgi:hypothetical protein